MSLLGVIYNPVFAIIFGSLLSIILYFRARRIKRLSYEYQDAIVISGGILKSNSELEIKWSGESVPRVSRTIVRFWNSGHETIRGNDISRVDPLRIEFPPGAKILGYQVERASRDSNAVIMEYERNSNASLFIKFDFIDRHDGAIVSVLHTAKNSEVKFKGTVQGIPDGMKNWGTGDLTSAAQKVEKKFWEGFVRYSVNIFGFAFVSSFLVYSLICFFTPDLMLNLFPSAAEPDYSLVLRSGEHNWRYLFSGIFFLVIFVVSLIFWLRRAPRSLS